MHNDFLTIGPLTFHMYGLMSAIGIIAAYLYAEHRAKKDGLDTDGIIYFVIVCVVSGYIGSKILYFITILPELIEDSSVIISSLSGGWVVYGGILGGMLGGGLYCRKKKWPHWKYFDMGLTCMALAQGFGRIGCFFAGCCYGVRAHGAFSVTFIDSAFAPNGIPLVPTQIASSIFDFLLFFFLVLYHQHRKNSDGEVTGLYLIFYSLGRFCIEFLRGDLIRGTVGPLSTSQFIAIFTFAGGAAVFARRLKYNKTHRAADADESMENADPQTEDADAAAEKEKEIQ
ncbi:MAG TPA: prolipoprotein diacylglyceryl transferase [Lachnospiraceae bacterium]|nr:prolipoprotein diacylglyceryl transferase [Lachnospiraceae bacterium]